MMRFIIDNGKVYLSSEYEVFFNSICREYSLTKSDRDFLLEYLFYYYDELSPYYNYSILERDSIIYRYQYSKLSEKEYYDRLSRLSSCIARIKEIMLSQEERVLYGLIERIDRIFKEYVTSEIDLENLSNEPKTIEAINKLLAMKERQKSEIEKAKGMMLSRNRGGKEESWIEKRDNKRNKE
jgi:hypothetical protein